MNRFKEIILSLAIMLLTSSCANRLSPQISQTALSSTSTPFPTSTHSPAVSTYVARGECIKSFHAFAYDGPPDTNVEAMPLAPWHMEASIPSHQTDGYAAGGFSVAISRSIQGLEEVWLVGSLSGEDPKDRTVFAIYEVSSQKWEFINGSIGLTDIYVNNLFVTKDGTIWGQTRWDAVHGQPTLDTIPMLSRFNDETRQFEFAQGVRESPLVMETNYSDWPKIVLDQDGFFWIFVHDDGIYRYDPDSRTTQRWADLVDFEVRDATLAPDGSIYLVKDTEQVYARETFFQIVEGMVHQFLPETGEIRAIDMPDEEWPAFGRILVDHTGRLWLGSIGYREAEGTWHLLHPHPDRYFEHAGEARWSHPLPILESSNGVLWFEKYLDSGGLAEGTAWYDPSTGEGCLFTNQPANIIEDSQQTLWLEADGKLYKYQLEP